MRGTRRGSRGGRLHPSTSATACRRQPRPRTPPPWTQLRTEGDRPAGAGGREPRAAGRPEVEPAGEDEDGERGGDTAEHRRCQQGGRNLRGGAALQRQRGQPAGRDDERERQAPTSSCPGCTRAARAAGRSPAGPPRSMTQRQGVTACRRRGPWPGRTEAVSAARSAPGCWSDRGWSTGCATSCRPDKALVAAGPSQVPSIACRRPEADSSTRDVAGSTATMQTCEGVRV